jgi:hypothetical protein
VSSIFSKFGPLTPFWCLEAADAIHVATERLRDCRFIIGDDRRLPVAPGPTVVQLGPHALDVMRAQPQ